MTNRVRGVLIDPEVLRSMAEARGLTTYEIAERAMLSRNVVRKALAGGRIDRASAYALGAVLDTVPPSESLGGLIVSS